MKPTPLRTPGPGAPRWSSALMVALLLALLIPGALLANPAWGPATALAAFTLKNNVGQALTDYHLVIEQIPPHPGGIVVDHTKVPRFKVKGGILSTQITPGMYTRDTEFFADTLTLDLTVGVPKDGSLLVNLPLKATKNTIRIRESYWTGSIEILDLINVKMGDVPVPGFLVEGDPQYTIYNDFDSAMGIRGLQFLFNVPEIDPDTFEPGAMPGFDTLLPDFLLPAHSSFTFFIPGMLKPGNYLYAQGAVFDETFTTEIASFIHGHEEPVPDTGSSLALLAPLLVWLAVPRRRAGLAFAPSPSCLGVSPSASPCR